MSNDRRVVGILIFGDVEVLDFCGPFEVFSTARLDEERRRETASPYDVRLVSATEKSGVVVAAGGLKVVPDHDRDDCPPLDVLVVPGGWGTRREMANERLIGWIAERSRDVALLASVCTGALLLGQAGILNGRRATTHWKSINLLREKFPDVIVVENERVVEDGAVLTSAGISAGIDMALQIVGRHHGEAVVRATARHMELPAFRAGNRGENGQARDRA